MTPPDGDQMATMELTGATRERNSDTANRLRHCEAWTQLIVTVSSVFVEVPNGRAPPAPSHMISSSGTCYICSRDDDSFYEQATKGYIANIVEIMEARAHTV
eukprot:8344-Amphidinium_carterae.1